MTLRTGRHLPMHWVAVCLAILVALSGAASAQVLRMGVGAQITSLDPHFHNVSSNLAFDAAVYDTLMETDARARLVPSLAESWRAIEKDLWELRLRAGVRFHDGTPFTADDVAFTIERVPTIPNSPGLFTTYTNAILKVEVVDDVTVRVRTRGPDPLLPINIAQIPILSRKIHTGATNDQFNSGRLAIGTGPYKVASVRFGDRIELVRNEGYWGPRPTWERVDYRMITNDSTRTAALLAGDVDIIDQVSTSDIERLRANPKLHLSEVDSLRMMFLAFDHLHTGASPYITDNDGKPLDRNPLKDLRVRRALDLALDRDALVSRVMEGVATATNQMIPAGAFGHVPDLVPPKTDRDAAKRLLEEAGYPNGFRLTLHTSNDRYPNDSKLAQAIGQMWTRVGVRTAVDAAPYASFIGRATRQELSAFLVAVGNSTGESSSSLRIILHSFDRERGLGSANRARYSNAAFDAKLQAAMQEMEDGRREAMLQEATRIAIGDLAIIPTHFNRNVWAMQRSVEHEARNDERSRVQDVRPAK